MVGTQLADSTRCSQQMLDQAALRRWLGANSIAFRAVRTGKPTVRRLPTLQGPMEQSKLVAEPLQPHRSDQRRLVFSECQLLISGMGLQFGLRLLPI
jgi:hypothetical protein